MNVNKKYLIIDFGGTLVKYSVMNREGIKVFEGEENAPIESKQKYISFIEKLYETVSAKFDIKGIAISMPGIVDVEKSTLVTAGSYLELYGLNLETELKEKIPVPVAVENDGKCGALAEVWKGNLKDCKDGIVVIIGTAIAGGVIKNRMIHKGQHLSAGEFSYIFMDHEPSFKSTVVGKCGMAALLFDTGRKLGIDVKKSPAYPLCSLFMETNQELSELNDDPKYKNGLDGHEFFRLLEEGNEIVCGAYDQYVNNLAMLILNLSTIYDPEKILIGGGVSRQPRLIKDIAAKCEWYDTSFLNTYHIPYQVDVCKFENEANQYGALYNFLTKYDQL